MNRIIITACALVLMGISAKAQVKVGNNPTTVNSSAVFEMESTNKGLLLPRMTTAQRTAIATPAAGLQVYDTTTNTVWYYNNSTWVNSGAATTVSNTLTGQSLSTTVNGVTGTAVTLPVVGTANGLSTVSGNAELGGALTKPTTITGLTATNKLALTATGVDAVNIDSNTLSVDATNNRVGIGTAAPIHNLSVDVHLTPGLV